MVCPRCDEQGLIYKAKILNLGIELLLCDECEACWLETEIIDIKNFKDLALFLEEHHLTYENTDIKDLGYIGSSERNRAYFNVSADEIIELIDEAWLMRKEPLISDRGAYVIDMKRIVGMQGEKGIKIIVKPGTAEIKTAYPIKLINE